MRESAELAAPQGFEPRYAAPEAAVLPLNEGATSAIQAILQPRWPGQAERPALNSQLFHHTDNFLAGQTWPPRANPERSGLPTQCAGHIRASHIGLGAAYVGRGTLDADRVLFFAQDFERTKPENAEARDPSRTCGEDRCSNQRYGRCVPIDMKAHFKLAQQYPREQIRKYHAN